MSNDSLRTVLVAMGAGAGVALAKAVTAAVTGSTALAAEAAHSLADTANDSFLLVAQRRSNRPPDAQHPLGYGREAYFWALIAALGVFVGGAAFSLRSGIDELIHPSTTSSFVAAYVVLAVSTVFDLMSLHTSRREVARRAHQYNRAFLEESRVTSDPTLRAVFTEDAVSVSGDVITLAALALNQVTGSSVYQGVAAVVIALVLIRISLRLIQRSRDFLTGAWSGSGGGSQGHDVAGLTQPIRPSDAARVRAILIAASGVLAVQELLFTFLGPGRVCIVARTDLADGMSGAQVKTLVQDLESGLKKESDDVYRVDIVPTGKAAVPAAQTR